MVKKKFMKTSKKSIIKGFTKARGRAPSTEEIDRYQKLHKETNIKWKEKPKKSGNGTYRIKYDHMIDSRYVRFPQNKEEAMRWIRADLSRFPHAKASLQRAKKPFGSGWKPHSSYKWRYNRKTRKHRLVKL